MSLADKYAMTSAKAEDKIGKTVISDESYAISEVVEKLTNAVNKARRSNG